MTQIAVKQDLKHLLYDDIFRPNSKNLDFTIKCQGKSFQFNKSKLSLISDVFRKMIETPNTRESKSGMVEIHDFSPDIIEAFNRVVFENNDSVDEKDLTVQLLMFANKYCVLSLVKVLVNHLSSNFTMENIFPVIKGAYLMDNDELLKNASKFVKDNSGEFQDNADWQELKKSHPQCFFKMMEFIMFQK